MEFTYKTFEAIISCIIENEYDFIDYGTAGVSKGVIMRHDVDYNLEKTLRIAEIEQNWGVSSTFFLMITCDFYNVFSASGGRIIEKLLSMGHDIGLHFDEMRYPDISGKPEEITGRIIMEAQILSKAVGKEVTKVSMHRPSKEIIEADLKIPGIINTYGSKYFKEYKYLSDSRRRWREPVLDIINGKQYERFQILVHPFWYNEEEQSLQDTVYRFINSANSERYHSLSENFTDLSVVMKESEVRGV